MSEFFSLRVPASWFELELRPERRDNAVKDLVNARVSEIPELFDHRTDITRVMRRFARSAWDSGARYAAAFASPADDTTVTGCITVTHIPFPGGSADADPVSTIFERISESSTGPGDDTWTRVSLVEIGDLGTCPRTYGIEDVQAPDGRGALRTVTMQTFVPTKGGNLLLISAGSPDLDLADELLELFDAVTATFTVGYIDDEADESVGAAR